MKIDKSIRSGNEKTDTYIAELENELTSFEASNTRKLIQSIDLLAGKIADDIVDVANGVKGKDSKPKEVDNFLVASYIKMVDKIDKISLFSEVTVKMMNAEVVNELKKQSEEANPAHKNGIDPTKNVFEQVQAMNKLNGKTPRPH